MAFPAAWPPRVASGIRSIRFYAEGTTTGSYEDNAFMFIDGAGANPFTPTVKVPYGSSTTVSNPLTPTGTGLSTFPTPIAPAIWSGNIRVCNDGEGDIEFSFDGINVHGRLKAGEVFAYRTRYESGMAVRGYEGAMSAFRVEAW